MSHSNKRRSLVCGIGLLASVASCDGASAEPDTVTSEGFLSLAASHLPNNVPIANGNGFSAAFSASGSIDFANEFNTPQGTNGRSCGTCHFFPAGWSIRPVDATLMFALTSGTHPLFNIIDANTPTSDVSTVEARWLSYSMLRQGKFLRLRKPPTNAEFDVIEAHDPFGYGTTSNLLFFRRVPPTANFRSFTVMWDGANTVGTDLRAGLVKQARSNVTGAQQGSPASDAVINAIVDQELGFSHAQAYVFGVGALDAAGAHGGPEAASTQPLVAGRFDIFDAWIGSRQAGRAQIARGQEIFNGVNAGNGRSCNGCHNAANNGQNVSGAMFNIDTSAGARAKADMAIYVLRNKVTGDTTDTTDPGKGFVTGLWSDVNRFKTPNLRGLSARPPYFHNGIAETLLDVVRHYESALGFVYTAKQEQDLVAFLGAL
jgi:cytochrome c peroxidase